MDRNNNVLAASSVIFNVFIDVRMLVLESEEVQADSINKIHQVLGICTERLWGYLALADEENKVAVINRHYHVIARQVPYDMGRALQETEPKHVHLEYDSRRVYRHDNLASSVLGFMRGDTMWGLEHQQNNRLTGTQGRVFYFFDTNRNVSMERIEAVEGNTIITTLDIHLQSVAERLCEQYGKDYGAQNASIIIMNPNTGEIYAMAQYPTFNLNDPTNLEYINNERLVQELSLLPHNEQILALNSVWRNYNVTGALEIGSVYKPFTVAKALEEGVITVNQRFYCGGYIMVGSTRIPCHRAQGHGDQSLSQTIANSCNVAMMEIADLMGRDIFHRYQIDFGYGERTGIDFQGEATGLLHTLPRLGPTELATASFGQRFTATPIQTAVSFASLINGGYVMQPYLVSQVVNERGSVVHVNTPSVLRKVISYSTSDWLREEMVKVVTDGTGRTAAVPGYVVAGKTGTAEQGLWGTEGFDGFSFTFAGYYPVENPRYLVVTIIDRVCQQLYDTGVARSSAPMFREMISAVIEYKNIPPENSNGDVAGGVVAANYVGLPAEQAIAAITNAGLEFDIIGAGGSVVTAQTVAPGSILRSGTKLLLSLNNSDGRQLIAVPDLTGMTFSEAEEALRRMGLEPFVTAGTARYNEGQGVVINGQIPDAGVRLPAGARVRVR
jgi:stage V sporulation protein D (sporulation-specific penicillin-binding protein)